ncbi:MAG: queuosine precursor transporter [Phycisphaeraceae bacterium]|nr:queuosine precursor transporter [Phycisphaeraceae bacterium]
MSEHRTIPSVQHEYAGLPRLGELTLYRRREGFFLLFAGLFLGTLAMLNILGITRFIKLFEIDFDGDPATGATAFAVAVGVLPYPITFLCTDFISEFYGRRRANLVVWIGLLLNLWVVFVLWLGGVLPGFEPADTPRSGVFFEVQRLAFGAVTASMIAYLAAQLVDVHVFHFWKRVTNNRHLWLRNNGSTLVSQLVDTTAVILITHFYARALPINDQQGLWPQLLVFIATGYLFKALVALADTVPFYVGSYWLARHLRLPPPHVPMAR